MEYCAKHRDIMNTMRLSERITEDHLHHAYVIESSKEEGLRAVRGLIEEFGIAIRGNPDFHEHVVDAFLLEHAELLRSEQSYFGAEGARKIFLVAFNTMLSEAQNALLKTLEEPTEGTHFFFVTETREHLLPTFLSRVQVIARQSLVPSPQSLVNNAGEKFLRATVSERMEMITPMTKAKDDDKPKAREDARAFLESLERAIYQKFSGSTRSGLKEVSPRPDLVLQTGLSSTEAVSALENVILAKRHLSGRSPSLKLLLEHLALTAPKVSD